MRSVKFTTAFVLLLFFGILLIAVFAALSPAEGPSPKNTSDAQSSLSSQP